jgi:hypothetical protein
MGWGCGGQDQKIKKKLQEWADDISCAIFGLAGAVTIMYHVLEVRAIRPCLGLARKLLFTPLRSGEENAREIRGRGAALGKG